MYLKYEWRSKVHNVNDAIHSIICIYKQPRPLKLWTLNAIIIIARCIRFHFKKLLKKYILQFDSCKYISWAFLSTIIFFCVSMKYVWGYMLTKASKQKKNEKQFVCLTSSDDYYLLCNELLCGIVSVETNIHYSNIFNANLTKTYRGI